MTPATHPSLFRRFLFPLFLLLLFIAALALGHFLRTPESHTYEFAAGASFNLGAVETPL